MGKRTADIAKIVGPSLAPPRRTIQKCARARIETHDWFFKHRSLKQVEKDVSYADPGFFSLGLEVLRGTAEPDVEIGFRDVVRRRLLDESYLNRSALKELPEVLPSKDFLVR